MATKAAIRVRGITIRVACAQLQARALADARLALRDIIRAIGAAERLGADLVVLPECSYPAYVLLEREPYRRQIPSDTQALAAIRREAARRRIDVCVGIARRDRRGALRNEAVYVDASGRIVGSYAKCRLWNFDRGWFARGDSLPVLDTRFGPIGMMICADGRNPEIARTLVAKGAWMILDPTAWVGTGPSHEAIRNPQVDYALRVRAAENGVWIAAADKCGSELRSVHYAGRSQVVTPSGTVAALADADTPQLITADVRKAPARPVTVPLSRGDAALLRAAPRTISTPKRVPPRIWLGIYQSEPGGADDPLALEALRVQGVHAIIRTAMTANAARRALDAVPGVRSQIVEGRALLAPEPARAAALRGADLLVWLQPPPVGLLLETARTRAMENRTYVAMCMLADRKEATCLVGPDGNVVASALSGAPSGFVAVVETLLARRKEVVPGTQTFADRMPHLYRAPISPTRTHMARRR
jgi:predicted amidohydrolase